MILAHIIADFLLQSPQTVAEKSRGVLRGYLLHFGGHCAALALLTHPYFSAATAFLWIALPAAHLLIDWLKNRLFPHGHPAAALIFLLDQGLHLLLIFCAWQWTAPPPCVTVTSFYRRLLTPAGSALMGPLFCSKTAPALFTAVIYGFVIFGGAALVPKVLALEAFRLPGPAGRSGGSRRAGRYIGMLERAIILSLTLADAFAAIAFVLTAKSIARYKELECRSFAEYYLAGTLLSTLLAILGGLLIGSARGPL